VAAATALTASGESESLPDTRKANNAKSHGTARGETYHLSLSSIPSIVLAPSGTATTQCEDISLMGKLSSVFSLRGDSSDASRKGTLESRYEVDWRNPIGEGSFGSVYTAKDKVTGEYVAVKKMTKKAEGDETFQREMSTLKHIRNHGGHPNICSLRSDYETSDHLYIVLELISGGEMFDHLASHGSYSEADAARLIREVASALAFLHGMNVVHGDLKPENRKLLKGVDNMCSSAFLRLSHYLLFSLQSCCHRRSPQPP